MTPNRRLVLTGLAATFATPVLAQSTAEDLAAKGYGVGDMSIGEADAPVTIIEYASLTCPHCAAFHKTTWPTLKTDYIDTGKARLVFREVYFDAYGLWGGMLARCGGADPYFGFIDLLLSRQEEWSRAGDQNAIVAEMKKIGRIGGLQNEKMNACLQDQDLARVLVDDYKKNIAEDGIDSTPSFIINGEKMSGSQPIEKFREMIEKHL